MKKTQMENRAEEHEKSVKLRNPDGIMGKMTKYWGIDRTQMEIWVK